MALASTTSTTQPQRHLMIVDAPTSMPPNASRILAGIHGQRMPTQRRRSKIADARNQSKITYPGTGNESQFSYDAFGRNVKIVEVTGGSITSTKQFVWNGNRRVEARDASGALANQYFRRGQRNFSGASGTSYFYTLDQILSIRELTDSSGNVQAQYSYDPYGQATKIQGSLESDFQFASYYAHVPSGLSITRTRAYSPMRGRFINRDLIGERGGINLFAYVGNNPISNIDPMGTQLKGGVTQNVGYPAGWQHARMDPAGNPYSGEVMQYNGDTAIPAGQGSGWTGDGGWQGNPPLPPKNGGDCPKDDAGPGPSLPTPPEIPFGPPLIGPPVTPPPEALPASKVFDFCLFKAAKYAREFYKKCMRTDLGQTKCLAATAAYYAYCVAFCRAGHDCIKP